MLILRRILRSLAWGASILLIAAFLVGYAAPYLSPANFWWTDLFAVGLPFLGGAVGVLGLGWVGWGWYRRQWRGLVVGGTLLLLLAVRFGPRLIAWTPPPPNETALRVMTLNVPPTFAGGRSPAPMDRLVRREAPDVLALQESSIRTGRGTPVDVRNVSASLQSVLADSGDYALPTLLPPTSTIQQPVLGRGTLDSMSLHPLPPDGPTNARSRYTRIEFTWRGRPAVLYNLHLHSVGKERPWTLLPNEWTSLAPWKTFLRSYREGALRRAQQVRLIRRRIARESRPVLVVGDFNSTPHQWAYRHLADGLQNAVRRRVRGWGATFPAGRPLVQIDHVLAGPAWQITAARVPAPPEAGAVSDHRPVVAHLRWK